MTIYQWLCLLGIPSILLGIFTYIFASFRKYKLELEATKLGVQALLRAQMIQDYNKWEEKGFAPIYARDNFENCWKHYHTLGANGVMDDLHAEFLKLPTHKETRGE